MTVGAGPRFLLLLCFTGFLCAPLRAATYLPMSDSDLVRFAPTIVRAEVVDSAVRVDRIAGADLPFTIVTLRVLETFKGDPGDETVRVRLPGGVVGAWAWSLPGTPHFESGVEVVVMLDAIADGSGERRLTEFGLAKFDLVSDALGRKFAIRPAFSAEADVQLSRLGAPLDSATSAEGSAIRARDGESFLAALRAVRRGDPFPAVAYALPSGDFVRAAAGGGFHTEWSNIGGAEPTSDGLFRWDWDAASQPSPTATAVISGTQSNLGNDDSCGTDSSCYVANAVNGWHGVPATNVQITGPSGTGNLQYNLDAPSSQDGGVAWNTPFPCEGGTIGLGGPDPSFSGPDYRGEGTYYQIRSGTVSMRKSGCTTGKYPGRIFKSAVLHESGHALGLGHPGTDPTHNEDISLHSTTTSTDWTNAVMHWSIPPSDPAVPQTDDIQAMQYLYGTAAPGAAPVASFTVSPSAPSAGSSATFTDASANAPTGWLWDFGDGSTSRDHNPAHTFAAAGTYTVKLYAGNFGGTGTATKTLAVTTGGGPPTTCVAGVNTLCLNANRFQVTADWEKKDGTKGKGTAISLTSDTGYFWFFSSSNIEVVTKVLQFCSPPFNAYWVFAAGLTDVQVTLTYTDTKNQTVVTKTNPQGTAFVAVQDTAAFKTCP